MDSGGHVQVHEACIVPYRLTTSGVQFCLVSPVADNRWEFPKAALNERQQSLESVLQQAATSMGLSGSLREEEPVGYFEASRGSESRSMVGYLMEVADAAETWPKQAAYRRLWCLAEEARARIRRKPLRRFIDLALRSAQLSREGRPKANGAKAIVHRPK